MLLQSAGNRQFGNWNIRYLPVRANAHVGLRKMSDRFVTLDKEAFEKFLLEKGFTKTETTNEVVFVRKHHKVPELQVKVYTSIAVGRKQSRECGDDAIRVVAVWDNGQRSFGVGKFPRVYRTAPLDMTDSERQQHVFDRVLVRMREAYARCNEWIKQHKQSKG